MTRLNIATDVCSIPLDQSEFNRIMGFGYTLPVPFEDAFQKVSTILETGTACAEVVFFDNHEVTIQQNTIKIKEIELQTGAKVTSFFKDCDSVALFICTLGAVFESRMKSFQTDPLEAYFADAIGSLKCEAFANNVHQQMAAHVAKEGFTVTNRYSPGYCRWDVSEQQKIFSFFGNTPTGITLNASSLMSPIKSISGIAGIGKGVENTPYLCDICTDTHCIYRKNNHVIKNRIFESEKNLTLI